MVQITFGPMTPIVDAAKDAYAAMPSGIDVRDRAAVSAYQAYKDAEAAAKSAYAAVPSALDVRDRAAVSGYQTYKDAEQAGVDATRAVKDAAKSAYSKVPTITFGPSMPLRDPPLTIPPPNAPVPAGPPPAGINNTVFPKGGVPMPATPQQQQAFGIVDAMQANLRKQDEMKRDYGPWSAAGISMGNQFGNNLLAVPSVVGDMLSAPLRDVYAASQGQPIPNMFGATPRLTVDKVVGGERALEAGLSGGDPRAAYNNARANIDMANSALQQTYPTSTMLGGVGGDVATLLAARMPFTRLPGSAVSTVAKSETMAPGAAKAITKAWEVTAGKLGRPLGKALETGVESSALAILNGSDPVLTGAFAGGSQLAGSGVLKMMHSPKAVGSVAALWMLYNTAERLVPGGDNRWGPALQHALDHATHALITGVAAAGLGAGRFKGSPHGASAAFADNIPLLADGINLTMRAGPMEAWAHMFKNDAQSGKPIIGPFLNKMMSDPAAFTSQELDGFAKSINDGTFQPYIEKLMGNESFRTRVGL